MSSIRVFVVDDHALFREGLLRLLEGDPELNVVGSANSAATALRELRDKVVDVLILDYDLGSDTALSLVRQLKGDEFAARILLVTAGLPDSDAFELIKLGISGIFHKHQSPEALQACIREIAEGKLLIDQGYLQRLLGVDAARRNGIPALTERDKSVLRGLLEGLSNKELASLLAVSESAVKASLQQLFAKTGVRTRSQLVRFTLEQLRSEL